MVAINGRPSAGPFHLTASTVRSNSPLLPSRPVLLAKHGTRRGGFRSIPRLHPHPAIDATRTTRIPIIPGSSEARLCGQASTLARAPVRGSPHPGVQSRIASNEPNLSSTMLTGRLPAVGSTVPGEITYPLGSSSGFQQCLHLIPPHSPPHPRLPWRARIRSSNVVGSFPSVRMTNNPPGSAFIHKL